MGPGEPGDRIQENDDVSLVLDEALGLFDDHVGHLHVPLGRLVEGGGDDLALDRALHVGDFFRTLVDEQDDEHDIGMIGGDGVGDVLQQHSLAGAGRSDDQPALAFAQRSEQIHDPGADVFFGGFLLDALLRIKRREIVKENLVARFLRRLEVHRLDLYQGKIFLAFVRRANLAAHRVARLQVKLTDLRGRNVDIVRAGEVVVVG